MSQPNDLGKSDTEMVVTSDIKLNTKTQMSNPHHKKTVHQRKGLFEQVQSKYDDVLLHDNRPFLCPTHIEIYSDKCGVMGYELKHWYQKVFITLEMPELSILGTDKSNKFLKVDITLLLMFDIIVEN